MSDTPTYPNRFVLYLLRALDEVMGQHGRDEALAQAGIDPAVPDDLTRQFPFDRIARLNAALDDLYGARGGRGMALRAGRAWFAQGMKDFGALSGVGDPAFRRLPLDDRVCLALRTQAEVFTHFSDQRSTLQTTNVGYRFTTHVSPFAWGLRADRPICHPLVGLLQECTRWASNGRDYTVRETHCIAAGDDSCTIVINA